MSNKIEYIVKYSVAPPPSRDYYGLKVLEDEVILHLWKISHGPHKAPIVYRAKLAEFDQEKSLQDKICYGFGEHLLKHVKDISEGNKNTLLTLPKSLIERLSRYLKFTDIVKLSSLSHVAYEIFNADSIWQILYKKNETAKISLEEKEKAKIYGWKQLYKDKQIEMSTKHQKNLRIQSSIKYKNDAKTNKSSLRSISDLKPVSKTISTMNITAKKHSESSSTDHVTVPLLKTMSESRFSANAKDKKSLPQKRNMKNVNSGFIINEKNVMKKDLITSKTSEVKNVSKFGEMLNKQILNKTKSEKYTNKINNINTKSQESKSKSVVSRTSLHKNTIRNIKSSSGLSQQNLHNKTQSNTKTKSKKKLATESNILNTDKELSNNPFVVRDNNFDLADLIEASLKNIRSPRSIFDYDFSCMQQPDSTTSAPRIKNEIQNIDKLEQLKATRRNVVANIFSNRMTQGDGILEKLSEKSEPFSELSSEWVVNDKRCLPEGDNKSLSLSEKYMKARAELKKSLNGKRTDPVSFEDHWNSCSDVNFQNKYLSPKKIDRKNNDEKFTVARGSIKTPFLLKTYASNSLDSKKDVSTKNSKVVPRSQIKSTKIAEDIVRNIN